MLLAFLLIPVLQVQLDIFRETVWNSHRIPRQKDMLLPDGFPVTEEQLAEVAQHSGVLEIDNDFLPPEIRRKCEAIIPFPEKVEPSDCADAYLYLSKDFIKVIKHSDCKNELT
ncbi:Hypothetical predicted protein [Paramuricea clavata]|uniref:Uncharacterized protein n=1 Tax=Paramuricea clavata TaxID=317549 RepID=A0A6S7FTP4_PARCT|nr:Hypothetical predicted protein [Paramuricea clavata]